MSNVLEFDNHRFTKVIVGLGETSHGPNMQWIDSGSRFALDKLASVGTHIPPELAAKIAELQKTLPSEKVAFYNRALGSFESYGINKNGDGFKRGELLRKHGTFVTDAHYYRHHQNKDPANSYGRPVASAYNEKTDIVDLIIVGDKLACLDEIEKLERGQSVPTSMGAKVAFDTCLICENKARNRMEYCEHVKVGAYLPYGMGNVLPDGRVCGVDNPDPRFFDLSKVIVPAAAESEHLMKVASARSSYDLRGVIVHSAVLAEEMGLSPKMADDKDAAMIKEVPGEIEGAVFRQAMPRLESSEKDIPNDAINKAVDRGGMGGLMRNTAAMGMVLKPEEFRRGVERSTGKKVASFMPPSSDEIENHGGMSESVFGGNLDSVVLTALSPHFSKRSSFQPALINRITQAPSIVPLVDKTAGEQDGKVREMYVAYRAQLAREIGEVGGQAGQAWAAKTAGTTSLLFGKASQMYAKLAFCSFDRPDLKDRIVIKMKKVAKGPGHQDTGVDFGRVSGSIADEFGEEALDLIAVQRLLQIG
jgi:hypothetical protein